MIQYGVSVFPTWLLLDREGKVIEGGFGEPDDHHAWSDARKQNIRKQFLRP
jgi:hypothetical protein